MADDLARNLEADESGDDIGLTIDIGGDQSETETETDPDAVVADGENEVEIALAPEQAGAELQSGVKRTLSHLRRDRRELRDDNRSLTDENAALRTRLDQLQAATLRKPQYADYADDDSYQDAVLKYDALTRKPANPANPAQPQPRTMPDMSAAVNAHIDRAERMGVSAGKFAAADQAVRDKFGDQLTDALISAVGEGSEKAVMIIGSDPKRRQELADLIARDPTGLQAVGYLGKLADRAQIRKRNASHAPKATSTPTGGVGKDPLGALKRNLEKAEKTDDSRAMFKARRALRQAEKAAV